MSEEGRKEEAVAVKRQRLVERDDVRLSNSSAFISLNDNPSL